MVVVGSAGGGGGVGDVGVACVEDGRDVDEDHEDEHDDGMTKMALAMLIAMLLPLWLPGTAINLKQGFDNNNDAIDLAAVPESLQACSQGCCGSPYSLQDR